MYGNILLSTDGSDVARKGVEHGIALAKALNAKVTVITVTEPLPVIEYVSGHFLRNIDNDQVRATAGYHLDLRAALARRSDQGTIVRRREATETEQPPA